MDNKDPFASHLLTQISSVIIILPLFSMLNNSLLSNFLVPSKRHWDTSVSKIFILNKVIIIRGLVYASFYLLEKNLWVLSAQSFSNNKEYCQQGTNENGTMNIYCLRSAEFAWYRCQSRLEIALFILFVLMMIFVYVVVIYYFCFKAVSKALLSPKDSICTVFPYAFIYVLVTCMCIFTCICPNRICASAYLWELVMIPFFACEESSGQIKLRLARFFLQWLINL